MVNPAEFCSLDVCVSYGYVSNDPPAYDERALFEN